MPKTITPGLQSNIAGVGTKIAFCWKLTRVDSVVHGFTNIDTDIVFDGVTYSAKSGYSSSNISGSADMGVGNVELLGLLDGETITEAGLFAGEFDGAIVEIFAVDYDNLALGSIALFKGELGSVRMENGIFYADVDPITSYLDQMATEAYSYNCRVREFGDSRCKLNLAGFTHTGLTVTGVSTSASFTTTATQADKYFSYGKITWTSGANTGLTMDVKTYLQTNGQFLLFMGMPYTVQIGDTFTGVAGCDRTPETCKGFSNFINYRGEPFLKGIDKLYSYPPLNPAGIED